MGSAAGVTVVLDCGGADADVDPELLKHLTITSPNESQLANLTGALHAITAEQRFWQQPLAKQQELLAVG